MAVSRMASAAAAAAIKPDTSRLRGEVLKFITAQGIAGATDEEIQLALGMSGNTERPRRRELEERGAIRESGAKRPTASGRKAAVWVATALPTLVAGTPRPTIVRTPVPK